MGQEYLRIQIYFPKGEARLYRAIQALAEKDGVSMAEIARRAIREYLDDEERTREVLGAASRMEAMEYIRSMDPCRHRSFDNRGRITCKVKSGAMLASRCVECAEYEPW